MLYDDGKWYYKKTNKTPKKTYSLIFCGHFLLPKSIIDYGLNMALNRKEES